MTICNFSNCTNNNLWKITNDNRVPPFYQECFVCNEHLNLTERFKEIHQSLVLGRFYFQLDNKVSYNNWNFEKIVTTWKRETHSFMNCTVCNSMNKIWVVVRPVTEKASDYEDEYNMDAEEEDVDDYNEFETNTLCDMHLNRRDFPEKPTIRCWNNDEGISPLEDTWTEEKNK